MFKQLFVLFLVVMMFGRSMQQVSSNVGGVGGGAGGPAGGIVGNGGGVNPGAAAQGVGRGSGGVPFNDATGQFIGGGNKWGK